VEPTVYAFVDRSRPGGPRPLETFVHVPPDATGVPLVLFSHGFSGHPRKFTRLFSRWVTAGYAVAAPAFPHTADTAPPPLDFEDLRNQPADVVFVLDRVLETLGDRVDPERVALAGFSLGAFTTLAAAFAVTGRDRRARVAIAVAGGIGPIGGECDVAGLPGGLPLLIVHATGDAAVPYASGREVYDRARPPKALLTLEGPHHEHVIEDEPAVPELVAVVDGATTAFLDLALRDDPEGAARLRDAVAPSPLASLETDGV
jgi:predicted dienelactone hydrolase